MTNIKEELEQILHRSTSAPILFIGSGLSKRYIGTDDWNSLLERFCEKLPQKYKYYQSKAGEDKLPAVASLMAQEFYDIWWKDDDYKEQREIYENEIKKVDSPLKVEIASYLKSVEVIEEREIQNEIALLRYVFKAGVIDTIITTNWDRFLEEEVFTDYDVLVGQDELLASGRIGIEEIHKIHGCISNPNSLILTLEDYQEFNDRNAYMAAKLLTTFIEHPIVFLGYAINDKNIQNILVNIGRCIPPKFSDRLSNNLIFVEPIFDDSDDTFTRSEMTIDNVNIPRIVIQAKNYGDIYSALLSYQRKFPIKLLKIMEQQLCEIVIKNNPHNQIIAGNIDNLSQIKEADFVVGLGINQKIKEAGLELSLKGISGLEYDEVLIDVMKDNIVGENKDVAKLICEKVLPKKPYFPLYKYLYQAEYTNSTEINKLSEKITDRLKKSYEEQFSVNSSSAIKSKIKEQYSGIQDIENAIDIDDIHKIQYIPLLEKDKLDAEKLKLFILKRLDLLNQETYVQKSNFRKLIRIYDWLVYGKHIMFNTPVRAD